MLFDVVCRISLSEKSYVGIGASACICGAIGLLIAKICLMCKKGAAVSWIRWRVLAMLIYLLI